MAGWHYVTKVVIPAFGMSCACPPFGSLALEQDALALACQSRRDWSLRGLPSLLTAHEARRHGAILRHAADDHRYSLVPVGPDKETLARHDSNRMSRSTGRP